MTRALPPLRPLALWTAAALTAVVAVVHTAVGTPEVLGPLLASDVPDVPAQTLRVVWHTTSVLLCTFPVALAWAARTEPAAARPVLVLVWFLCAAFAATFLAVGADAFGASLLVLPQWVLFLPPLVLVPLSGVRRAATTGSGL